MAAIDKYLAVKTALVARQNIHQIATQIAAISGPTSFNTLARSLESMRESNDNGILPMLALGTDAQVNTVAAVFFAGLPANAATAFKAIGTALTALYAAYDPVFETLTPVGHTPAGGHTYASIPLATLTPILDEANAVVAATSVFE